MILDQGIGAHHAQVDYLGMGWAWTWVSGESAAPVVINGPYYCAALGTHTPGAVATGTHRPGQIMGGTHQPGMTAGGIR